MIVILDYGMGNVGSIQNMLRRAGAESIVSSAVSDISAASKLILPGVGAFDRAMGRLHDLGIVKRIEERVLDEKIPLLGICLGMQLLCHRSEEGAEPGLGWVDANVERFYFRQDDQNHKVPHMGWSTVSTRPNNTLFRGMPEHSRFYFVHSYHVVCRDEREIIGTAEYGHSFVAALQQRNIWGVQFHPEKSHRYGLQLLTNFAKL
jgi:glutamine amidotransferase